MITNYNEYINEKISDKLSGFNADELKQQFLNNKIIINKYLDLCYKNNLPFPSDEEIKNYFLNNQNKNLKFYYIINAFKKYNIKIPSIEILKPYFLNGSLQIYEIKSLYNYEPTLEELHQAISNLKMDEYSSSNYMLVLAAMYNFLDLVKISTKYKSDLSSELSAIHYAIENENLEMIKFLLEYGVEGNSKYEAKPILLNAIEKDNIDIAKCLLYHGAKVYDSFFNFSKSDEMKKLLQKYYDNQL